MLPCILFEDEHLLVVNKPAGWNTHAPSPFAGEGIYDWLKHREPRWASLAILHRLDKETSGILVFGKTPLANRSLTAQFAGRVVRKKYLLLTDRRPSRNKLTANAKILRAGERYVGGQHGEPAVTTFQISKPDFELLNQSGEAVRCCEVSAEPLTGRTHQIRVHAADLGFPILGDTLYGGTPWARVCLHAGELSLRHPATDEQVSYSAPADFVTDPRLCLRTALVDAEATNAFRVIHGASDGWPGWYVDRLGDVLLSQSEAELTREQQGRLAALIAHLAPNSNSVYHKILSRNVGGTTTGESSPKLLSGEPAPGRFAILENGVKFELSFGEGYSVGLFLDQRDNRRRFLTGQVAADFSFPPTSSGVHVLNTFAYTCGFSVCAALAGARTTSLDLSKKYLEWGRQNFALNGLDHTAHDFIYGDTFDWLRRFARKSRQFDVVVLDPPTFSQSKQGGAFRVQKDYRRLVLSALAVLKPGGVLFCSTNDAGWPPENFVEQVKLAVQSARRRILLSHYAPQPPDFPVTRLEPAYLKTIWLSVD